jgi:hypothetical protein
MSNIGLANRHLIKCMQFDNIIAKAISKSVADAERIRAIAYSMDTLVPGFYVWLGSLTLRVGGCIPDDQPCRYPGTLHSRFGLAIVLPGYHIFTTHTGSYGPRQAFD